MDGGRFILFLIGALAVGCRKESVPAEGAADALATIETTTNLWGPVTNSTRMSIEISGGLKEWMASQPFSLNFRIENLSSNRTICFWNNEPPDADAGRSLHCVVTSLRGKDVSPKYYFDGGSGVISYVEVLPNESKGDKYRLSEVCKITEPGIYTIIAIKDVGVIGQKAAFSLVSNPLRVRVVLGD